MDYLERNRDFKGVWIPKNIWLNDNLTILEKVILVEIDSLDNEDHCVAGNDYLAQFCQCSESKVSGAVKKLQELGYIEVIAFDGRHRRIRSCLLESTKLPPKKYEAASEKPKAINITNNLESNIITHGNCETSSPSEDISSKNDSSSETSVTVTNTPTPSTQPKKRLTRKEQLVNYVNELDYSEETKSVLMDWIFQIGIGRGVTVHQLHDMLKDIWDKYDNEDLVRQSIKESYLKNWFGFFPLKNSPVQQQDKPKVEQRKADPSQIMDIKF